MKPNSKKRRVRKTTPVIDSSQDQILIFSSSTSYPQGDPDPNNGPRIEDASFSRGH